MEMCCKCSHITVCREELNTQVRDRQSQDVEKNEQQKNKNTQGIEIPVKLFLVLFLAFQGIHICLSAQ